jgi:co-chaperonin GroES (HSP10)
MTTIKNNSGILPLGFNILVEMEPVEEKTESGIIININPKMSRLEIVKGTLIAKGENAFSDLEKLVPQIGDKILVTKHAGKLNLGNDEKEYRIMADAEVDAILIE